MVFRSLRRYQRPLLIGVTVFVLLTFSITGAVITALAPSAERDFARFVLPSGRTVLVDYGMFREFGVILGQVGPFAPQPGGGDRQRLEEEDVFSFLMLYSLATDLGLDVGTTDVRTVLQGIFQGRNEDYRNFLRAKGWRAPAFEEWLRRVLLVDRYRSFLVTAYGIPTPEDIEREWRERNALFTLEAVALAPATYEGAVAAMEPADEELTALQAGLTPLEQARMRKPDRIATEGLSLEMGEEPPAKLAALLEGDPEPSTEELLSFYKRYETRYLPPREPETRPVGEAPKPLPFEEVENRVRREYRFKRAMDKVLARAREPEAPSLEGLAEEFGLETFVHSLSNRAEIQAVPRFADPREVDACFDPFVGPEGSWVARPLFSPLSVFAVRVVRRVPMGLASLDHDRADYVALWRKRKQVSDARSAAEEFRNAIDAAMEGEDREGAFAREAETRGFTVERIGPFALGARLEPGFFEKPAGLEKFLMSRVDLLQDLEPGAVVGPEVQGAEEAFVVFRLASREDPDPSTMRPKQVREAFQTATRTRMQEFFEDSAGLFERLSRTLQFERLNVAQPAPAEKE